MWENASRFLFPPFVYVGGLIRMGRPREEKTGGGDIAYS